MDICWGVLSQQEKEAKARGTLKEKATFPNLQGDCYGLGTKCPPEGLCLRTLGPWLVALLWGVTDHLGSIVRRNGWVTEGRDLVPNACLHFLLLLLICRNVNKQVHNSFCHTHSPSTLHALPTMRDCILSNHEPEQILFPLQWSQR